MNLSQHDLLLIIGQQQVEIVLLRQHVAALTEQVKQPPAVPTGPVEVPRAG